MKRPLLSLFGLFIAYFSFAQQQNYSDFEGMKYFTFGQYTGQLDSVFANAYPNTTNSSSYCAWYKRDTEQYDYIKMYTDTQMVDVSPYSSNSFNAPRIRMKVYTTAPAGTAIILQLGIKSVDNYPAGIHSEYIANTTMRYAWEQLTFSFFQAPSGSLAGPTDINKMVLLFYPNSTSRDTFLFDDITGPPLVTNAGVPSADPLPSFKLFQNSPNPSKTLTHINFQLNSAGYTTLKVYDVLGNAVITIVDQNLKSGNYSFPVETAEMPEGVYFYVLQKGGFSRSMKMVVSQ
jgi:hypothetical protein